MGRVTYLVKRIAKMDYKNMFKIAGSISKKTKKNRFQIVADMIKCGITYQAGYYDYQEFEFYNLNNEERKTYLTRGKNNEIVRKFNKKESFYKFDDKSVFVNLFNNYLKRNWMILNDDNVDKFIDFIKTNKAIIVKPLDGEGGKGIEKFVYDENVDYKEVYNKLIENKQLLVEECIVQHPDMSKLYPESVNTLRMFTFYKEGEAYFLQAILKIGNGGVVDNFSSGGMYTYVNNEGEVYVEAIDRDDNIFSQHPITKEQIVGFKVPMFNKAVELVKEASREVPEIAYVGWDVAITKDEPVIIEGNCYPGVFQVKPSLVAKKEGLIPMYNKIMGIF